MLRLYPVILSFVTDIAELVPRMPLPLPLDPQPLLLLELPALALAPAPPEI
ncbi:MAG TPA: hypothetical protein VH062_26620 [Polyangiaceae bacterium]|jgi:hypothetical protein|nr:hypothetical protein [Polyangiaceae bacterium]